MKGVTIIVCPLGLIYLTNRKTERKHVNNFNGEAFRTKLRGNLV